MSVTTFQTCPVAGSACSPLSLLGFLNLQFYKTTPSCFNTDPSKPTQLQCLPTGFKSIIRPETTDVNFWTIKNSIFDICSPTEGADAGCGFNLQCNYYKSGTNQRYICEPAKAKYNIGPVPINAIGTYESAIWHQTCGTSASTNLISIKCDQTTIAGPLVCTPVNAYVKGVLAKKSICITSAEKALLQKRVVKNFCYSGCPPSSYSKTP